MPSLSDRFVARGAQPRRSSRKSIALSFGGTSSGAYEQKSSVSNAIVQPPPPGLSGGIERVMQDQGSGAAAVGSSAPFEMDGAAQQALSRGSSKNSILPLVEEGHAFFPQPPLVRNSTEGTTSMLFRQYSTPDSEGTLVATTPPNELEGEKAKTPNCGARAALEEHEDDGHSAHMQSTLTGDEARAKKAALAAHIKLNRGPSQKEMELKNQTLIQAITRHRFFEIVFALMIISNSILLAVETQQYAENLDHYQHWSFATLHNLYNIMFIIELFLRFGAEGVCGFYLKPHNLGWALLDTVVVTVSVAEMTMEVLVAVEGASWDSEGLGQMHNMRIVRMLRVARMLRTFRAFRLVRFMVHLQTLLFSIYATLKSLAWATVLMTAIIYVFAVTFTQCASDGREMPEMDSALLLYYWGSLDRSMGTLFQSIANGISWREAYELLNNISLLCGWMFLLFIIFAYFVLLNVVTGVFCNSAIEGAQKNPELIASALMQNKTRHMAALTKLFQSAGGDDSGMITIVDFETMLQDEMAHAQFQALELNVSDAWTLFKLIDDDNSGTISIEEFMTGCEALKGGARSIDVAAIRYEHRLASKKVIELLTRVELTLQDAMRDEKPSLLRMKALGAK